MRDIAYRAAGAAHGCAIAASQVSSLRAAYAGILDADFLAGPIEADRLAHWTTSLEDASPSMLVQAAVDADRRLVGFICAHRNFDPQWGSWVDNLHIVPG